MNRLFKLALIGDISKSDINFIVESGIIRVEITNPEKIKHNEVSWGEYYRSFARQDLPNVVGFINYSEKPTGVEGKITLYVNYLEVHPKYRGTLLAKWLLEKFEDEVLNQYINQYGKENVYLGANFANQDLARMLKRVTKKMGIKWSTGMESLEQVTPDGFEEQDISMVPEEFRDIAISLSRIDASFNYTDLDGFVIHNFNIKLLGGAICNKATFDDKLYGEIDNSGDITIMTSPQGASSNDQTFEYTHSNSFVEFYGDVMRDEYIGYPNEDGSTYNEDNGSGDHVYLETNMNTVFRNVTTFQYRGKAYTLDDIIGILTGDGSYSLIANKINRLRKIANKKETD